MNTEIKSAEEIIKQFIPEGIVNIKSKGKGNGKPQYQAEIGIIKKCMEEYHAQFKQPDISEDVRKAAEKYLTDLGIANTGMFTSRTMLKTFEDGAEWQRQQPIPTVDEDELIEAIKLIKEAIPNSNGEWGKRATDFISKHQTNNL